MKKLILFLLIGALLVLPLSGCFADNKQNEGTTPNNTTENTTPEVTTPEATTPPENNTLPTPSENNPFGDKATLFTSDLLIQAPFLSAEFALDIRSTENGEIYLNNISYEYIGVHSNLIVTYEESMLYYDVNGNEEITNILERINDAPNCYVLETQSENHFAKKVSVYYIEGVYYFLDTFGGTVTRIWCSSQVLGE